MFAECANSLLAGKIICPVTSPHCYEYLSNEDNLEDMNSYFSRIERTIHSPVGGGSYLLTYKSRGGSEEQSRLREIRKQYIRDIEPVIKFVELVLRAENSDNMIQPGDDVQVGVVSTAIAQSEALGQELQALVLAIGTGSRTDANITSRVQAVFKRLETWGYLKLIDQNREIYRVTGKLDVFHELIAFLRENIPGAKDEDRAFEEQGTML
jgi:hypothetical protein